MNKKQIMQFEIREVNEHYIKTINEKIRMEIKIDNYGLIIYDIVDEDLFNNGSIIKVSHMNKTYKYGKLPKKYKEFYEYIKTMGVLLGYNGKEFKFLNHNNDHNNYFSVRSNRRRGFSRLLRFDFDYNPIYKELLYEKIRDKLNGKIVEHNNTFYNNLLISVKNDIKPAILNYDEYVNIKDIYKNYLQNKSCIENLYKVNNINNKYIEDDDCAI